MDAVIARQLAHVYEEGQSAVLCMVVEESGSTPRAAGASMIVFQSGRTEGTIGGGITEHRVTGKALDMLEKGAGSTLFKDTLDAGEATEEGAACGGTVTVYLEVVGRRRELVIFGAGHVGKAIARAGDAAGFAVTVWDERAELANPENIQWGKTICCPLEELDGRMPEFHGDTYAVIVTRGHSLDAEVTRLLEGKRAAYIGMIGSRKKIAFVREQLLSGGVSPEFLDGIFQPVGIPIRAETPEEIAVSVLAEIIAVSRGADIVSLRASL
ncbi:XdhC family protein [Aminivibrio sp.]|jgi:xanthine dehydrogenase accessory factor|uniref:XdhC family protein n=1 Tax=Aminivibrio sp. TaxID=1872489 RepID=UPI003D99172F